MPTQESLRTRQVLAADSRGARGEQQDAALVLESADHGTALLMVSDGVGGNSGGRIASQTVTELARKLWEERKGELSDPYADLGLLCRISHQQINEEGQKRGLSPRATIVALYLTPTQAHWAHSGDSRLYHFRNGQFVERTEDHSLIQVMVNQGMVDEEDMGRHPDQGALLQSLGGEEYKEPSHGNAEIGSEDSFLLCTDGFWERTPDAEMAALLQCPQAQAKQHLEAAIETAVRRNGSKSDNVTVAIALPISPQTAPSTPPPMPTSPPTTGSKGGGRLLVMLALIALLFCAAGAVFLLWGYLNKPITVASPNPPSQTSELDPAGRAPTRVDEAAPPSPDQKVPPPPP